MKLLSWNINGLRACIKNGFLGTIKDLDNLGRTIFISMSQPITEGLRG